MAVKVVCSSFLSLTSANSGTVLNVINYDVFFENCKIFDVSSSKNPGCIYVSGGKFRLNKCAFAFCFGAGNDNVFARTCFIENSNTLIKHFSAYYCGPKVEHNADSLCAFKSSCSAIDYYNSTLCYGVGGSSAIALVYISADAEIKHLNSISCNDYCSIEIWTASFVTDVMYSNFINTSYHTGYTFNIVPVCNFKLCSFASFKSFAKTTNILHFDQCVSDAAIGDCSVTVSAGYFINFYVYYPKENCLLITKCYTRKSAICYSALALILIMSS